MDGAAESRTLCCECGAPDCANDCRRPGRACRVCGYALFIPLAMLEVSDVGLYDDARYPGRLVVAAHDHHTHVDEMSAASLRALMVDVQAAARVVRALPGVTRANVAIMGNREPHVHVHVIPRRATDVHPERAPWDHAPPLSALTDDDRAYLEGVLRAALQR